MTVRRVLATVTAAALMLTASACGAEQRHVEPPVGESGVVMWPDYGDFHVAGNKAILAVTNLRLEDRVEDADMLSRIALTAQARWVGDWMTLDQMAMQTEGLYRGAETSERIALVSMVGIPGRGCDPIEDVDQARELYRDRIATAVAALADFEVEAWFVLEVGAIPNLEQCGHQDLTVEMLNTAIELLDDAGVKTFVDAGPARDSDADPEGVAERLALLDLDRVAGITIGTGGFDPEELERERGDAIIEALAEQGFDGLTYLLDSSRNGANNPPEQTCNPEGQAIGKAPRIVNDGNLEAYVWIKRPGESDGSCRVAVTQGQFSVQLGLELARNADPDSA